MLYLSEEYPNPIYIQGAYMPEEIVKQLAERINETGQYCGNKFVIPETAGPDSFTSSDALSEAVQIDSKDEKEFVEIILSTLENDTISVEKIKRKFSMGNRARGIVDKLCEAGLVSRKVSNQPRTVLPQSIKDIPDAVMEFLIRHGVSAEDIAAAISKRNSIDLVVMEGGNSNDTRY